MSDYRPVRRAASGNKHVWLLLHVATGEMAGGSGAGLLIFTSKGTAIQAGEVLTAERLNPNGLTARQAAKRMRREAEAVERDKAFVPHQPPAPVPTPPIPPPKAKAAAKAKPAGTSRPGRSKGTTMSKATPDKRTIARTKVVL